MIKLHLPFPPSVNSLYPGNGKRRWKSKKYKEWENSAGLMLDTQHCPPCITYPVQVVYKLGRPDKRARDVFNLEKALSDFLVARKIIEDDTLIHCGTVTWADIEGCDIIIAPHKVRDSEWWAGFIE